MNYLTKGLVMAGVILSFSTLSLNTAFAGKRYGYTKYRSHTGAHRVQRSRVRFGRLHARQRYQRSRVYRRQQRNNARRRYQYQRSYVIRHNRYRQQQIMRKRQLRQNRLRYRYQRHNSSRSYYRRTQPQNTRVVRFKHNPAQSRHYQQRYPNKNTRRAYEAYRWGKRSRRAYKDYRYVQRQTRYFRRKGVRRNAKNMRKLVRTGKKVRRLSRFGYDAAGRVIGVKRVPDAIDAAEWTYNSMRDPSKIPQRTDKLVKDAGKTFENVGRTVTNPKRMGRNAERTVNSIGKTIGGIFK